MIGSELLQFAARLCWKQTAFNQKDSLTTGPKMSKGTRQTSLTQCLWTAWGERTAECGQAYVLSLNSTSYCLHWRQNAGPDGPCWDPLGYFLCFLILKKFWSSLFQTLIPGQSINNLEQCSQMCHRPEGQLTTTRGEHLPRRRQSTDTGK